MHPGDEETLDHFVRTRQKTIELAERIPSDLLALEFQDWGGMIGRNLLHIAEGVDWWMHNVIGDGRGPEPDYRTDGDGIVDGLGRSRDRLLAFLADGSDAMGGVYTFQDPEMRRQEEAEGNAVTWVGRAWVHYITDHEIHHRGKIVLALRQAGFRDFPFLP
jgi:uncharacterized damage-inducible protein DinB